MLVVDSARAGGSCWVSRRVDGGSTDRSLDPAGRSPMAVVTTAVSPPPMPARFQHAASYFTGRELACWGGLRPDGGGRRALEAARARRARPLHAGLLPHRARPLRAGRFASCRARPLHGACYATVTSSF
jgi:hypothetical protein